ncbi:MAG: 4-alpha-glucanotransferase [Acidobacteria bacterium]|nr:4-alpha-glucanotransferase [Acidobacteriota bacterium]
MKFTRSSGILLHPTSLPGRYGIGELGFEAYRFVDAMERGGQTLWQILPLGPTGYGDSPYQAFSAFAGNTLLTSLELLVKEGLLTDEELQGAPTFAEDRVDFGQVTEFKDFGHRARAQRIGRRNRGAEVLPVPVLSPVGRAQKICEPEGRANCRRHPHLRLL